MLNEHKVRPLTEDDVRRIVREELDAWAQEFSPVLDGPTGRMREIMQSEGEAN